MLKIAACIIIGYLIGSVPFALVIGKLFYNTDVRQFGSGNLGGGNTGRVLGKKAGVSVMTLDLLKVSAAVGIAALLRTGDHGMACAGLAAGIGHCYPLFAKFRGGKAVAALYGFLFGLIVFAGRSLLYFLLPLFVFLVVLYLSRIIALASIVSAAAVTVYVFCRPESLPVRIAVLLFTIIIVIRHRSNLDRIRHHEENRITWMGK